MHAHSQIRSLHGLDESKLKIASADYCLLLTESLYPIGGGET